MKVPRASQPARQPNRRDYDTDFSGSAAYTRARRANHWAISMETSMRTGLMLLCFAGVAACSQMGMKSPGQSAGQGATASTQDAKFVRDIAQANLA